MALAKEDPGSAAGGTAGDQACGRTWLTRLERSEQRTFVACFTGWLLDAFDVQLYSLVIPVLISIHFIGGTGQAGLIGTVALLSSSVGGWVAGALSDRIGRVRTLQLTILWFSVFTALSGLSQTAHQLLLIRGLMGFGFGGEWAAGAALIAETVRPEFRGRAIGSVQSGWALGWGLAVLSFVWVSDALSDTTAWRVLFALGLVPALLVLYIRRSVQEPAALGVERRDREVGATTWLTIFAPGRWRRTVLCAVMCTGAQGGYYALTTFLPTYLSQQRHLKLFAVGGTLALIIAGAFAGYVVGAWLADLLGRKRMLVLTALGAFAVVIPMVTLGLSGRTFTLLCFPFGFFASAYFSGIGPMLSDQFPSEVRGSGMGFAYNFGRGIGALFPWLVGRLGERIAIGTSIAVFAGVAYALLIATALALPEARRASAVEELAGQ